MVLDQKSCKNDLSSRSTVYLSGIILFPFSLSVGKAKRCLRHSSTSSAVPCLSAPSTCQEPSCHQRPSSETLLHSHLMCLRSGFLCPTFSVIVHFVLVPHLTVLPISPFKACKGTVKMNFSSLAYTVSQ